MNILYINKGMELGGVEKCIIQLTKMYKNQDNKIVVASMGGELVSELDKIGVKHETISSTDCKSPLNIIKILIKIYKIIKDYNIEIIHSHHRMTTLLSKIVSKFTNTKLIHTQHLCIEDKYMLTNLSLKNIPIITVSESAKRILIEKANLKAENIITIYNTIETNCENKMIDDRLINLKNREYFIVAQISRIVDYKGVYDFIEIAQKTSLENKKIKFVLIGDGPEVNNLIDIINKEKLEETVFLLGAKDNIIEYFKYIDILLLCSYIEGLPLTPLEAFSQGVPVIATNINGTNEEIIEGENGYLVNKKDIQEFKEKIIYISIQREKYKYMSERCRMIFSKNFSKEKYIRAHNKIYRMLLK